MQNENRYCIRIQCSHSFCRLVFRCRGFVCGFSCGEIRRCQCQLVRKYTHCCCNLITLISSDSIHTFESVVANCFLALVNINTSRWFVEIKTSFALARYCGFRRTLLITRTIENFGALPGKTRYTISKISFLTMTLKRVSEGGILMESEVVLHN